MKKFIDILFDGMWNGYLKHMNFIDDHWSYGRIKIPEYIFTISTADTIFKKYGNSGGYKVIVEGNVKLIKSYSTSCFGGPSFALKGSVYQKLTTPKKKEGSQNQSMKNEYPQRVDILVCDKRASYIPKYVIEIKGINPSKENILKDIDKLKEILNFIGSRHSKSRSTKNSIEFGFIVGVNRLDRPNLIIDSEYIRQSMLMKERKMCKILEEKLFNENIIFKYEQRELDCYTEEEYASSPDPDKDGNEAKALTHAYIAWVISLWRKEDNILDDGLSIDNSLLRKE